MKKDTIFTDLPIYIWGAIIFVVCYGVFNIYLVIECTKYPLKEFLFNHPEIKIQINMKGKIYYKNSSRLELQNLDYCRGEIITIFIGQKEHTFLLEQKVTILSNKFLLQYHDLYTSNRFRIKEINKKGENMGLSIGTWLLLIIVIFIVVKISPKFTLRSIFRPIKKMSKRIEQEWDDS